VLTEGANTFNLAAGTASLDVAAGAAVNVDANLTVTAATSLDEAVAMSSKAPKASPTFTGDVTLAGKVVNTTLPAFLVAVSGTIDSVTGDGTAYTIVFGTEIFDQANNFSNTTFTAPVTGRYQLSLEVFIDMLNAAHNGQTVQLMTSNRGYYACIDGFAAGANPFIGYRTYPFSILTDMDAGDTAYIILTVSGGNKIIDVGGSVFSGHLVC